MSTNDAHTPQSQDPYGSGASEQAFDALLSAAGVSKDEWKTAFDAIKAAKSISKQPLKDEKYNFFLDKTMVYPDVDAFIFKRADSKSGRYYIRMYDDKNGKQIIKSLKTSDKTQALVTARSVYIDYKGKIDRGERIKAITTAELIKIYTDELSAKITPIPKKGITPETLRLKQYYLRNWSDFIEKKGLTNKKIDKILPEETMDFCEWINAKPKDKSYSGKSNTPRSVEQINNMASEVRLMYYKIAVKQRFISENQVPQIERLRPDADSGYKRDILTADQYETYWKYLEYNYTTRKHNKGVDEKELIKRRIYKDFIGISYNMGTRPMELLKAQLKDIQVGEGWSKEAQETNCVLVIPKENSKTGKSRRAVGPIKKRVDRIIKCYKELGIELGPNDYLFTNPISKTKKPYGRMIMYTRLRKTLVLSGLQNELDELGRSITLYSSRHAYACWRLRHGSTPIHLLSKQMGTSISKLELVYGHIEVEQEVDKITKNQGFLKRSGISLDAPMLPDDD